MLLLFEYKILFWDLYILLEGNCINVFINFSNVTVCNYFQWQLYALNLPGLGKSCHFSTSTMSIKHGSLLTYLEHKDYQRFPLKIVIKQANILTNCIHESIFK